MLSQEQRERIDVVLVSPRNPLNIGAAARAMANFGFSHLTVVAPYEPHWREARSAVGAPDLLENAKCTESVAEAVADCTFVAGTGTRTHRKPEQPIVLLPEAEPLFTKQLARGGRAALIFGPEKHGLTRDDLSYCHALIEVPTSPRQPSMNLGQAVSVCLYELARGGAASPARQGKLPGFPPFPQKETERMGQGPLEAGPASPSGMLDRLADLIEETMTAAGYSPRAMRPANRHDLGLLLRRMSPSPHDTRRMLGLFRRILHRLQRRSGPSER